MITETQQTILATTQRRLAEILARQQELQTHLEEATALREEQQCLEQLLAWYELHAVIDAPPPPAAGLDTARESPQGRPDDAALPEALEVPGPTALGLPRDPVEAELLALLDPAVPQPTKVLQAHLNTHLGTNHSYSVVDNRLRRNLKHGRTQRTVEGWLLGPAAVQRAQSS